MANRRDPTSLQRRRRNSARGALYLGLVLLGAILAGLYAWMRPTFSEFGMMIGWAKIQWEGRPEVELLREYVAIDTSMPPAGDPVAGARWVAEQLSGMGLDPVVERVGDEANVWAILEGQRREAVVLHHHIDVDPTPHPELWQKDPFGGEIDGPWIYGRGTFDMKSVAVAQLLAVRDLLAGGGRPELSVIVLATSGEETGSDLGMKWILRQHPELVERFAVVLTEGGAVEGRSADDLKYWGTEFLQKRLFRVSLCGPREVLVGIPGELRRLGLLTTDPELVPEVERFLSTYAPTRDAEALRELLSEPRRLLRDPARFKMLTPYLKGFFQNQLVPQGLVERGGVGELRFNLLLLPREDPEAILDELLPRWMRHGLELRIADVSNGGSGGGSSLDHWAFRTVDELMAERYPGVVHGPLVLPLTLTDARFLRAEGIPAYGFSPFVALTPQVYQLREFGTVNERLQLVGYSEGVELYAELLQRLAGLAGTG